MREFNFRNNRMKNVVDEADAITSGKLPPALVGKTPEEIAQYYAGQAEEFRERVMENARRIATEGRQQEPPRQESPRQEPPRNTEAVTRQEFTQTVSSATPALITVAKMEAKEGKPDWDRLFPEIKKIMDSLPTEQQINSATWIECYYNVKGRAADTLVTEARNRALGLEPPSPPITLHTKAKEFTPDETKVMTGLGVSKESYEEAGKKLDSGFQPFTIDSKGGK